MSLSRSTVGLRSIYLKVKPAPANLSERRAVLQVLKQHGGIDVFLKLPDPSSFVSITRTTELAQQLVANSPLQFDFDRQPAANLPASARASSVPRKDPTKKTFTVHAFSGEKHTHFRDIEMSPLYGPWPDERSPFDQTSFLHDGLAGSALRHAIPQDMAATGLRDWETGAGPSNAMGDVRDYVALRERVRKLRSQPVQSVAEMYEAGVAWRSLRDKERPQDGSQELEQNSQAVGPQAAPLAGEPDTAGPPDQMLARLVDNPGKAP